MHSLKFLLVGILVIIAVTLTTANTTYNPSDDLNLLLDNFTHSESPSIPFHGDVEEVFAYNKVVNMDNIGDDDQYSPFIHVSPFTNSSKYLEFSLENFPNTTNDKKYEVVVIVRGLVTKDIVNVDLVEGYKVKIEDEDWLSKKRQTIVYAKHIKKTDDHMEMKLDAKFNKVDGSKYPTYGRALLFQVDIKEWLNQTHVEITATVMSKSTKIKTEFKTISPASPPLALKLKSHLTKPVSNNDKEKSHQSFSFTFEHLQTQLDNTSSNLTLYSYFSRDYYFISSNSSHPWANCTLGSFYVPASLRQDNQIEVSFKDLKADQKYLIDSTQVLNCPEFLVLRNHTKLHYSEYWVAFTQADGRSVTDYVRGVNRADTWVFGALVLFAVVLLFVIITFTVCGICICKKKKVCCFKPKDHYDPNLPATDYYSRL